MSKKTISFSLDAKSIQRAIAELEEYKQSLQRKTENLQKRLAELIAVNAQTGFSSAIVDDTINVSSRPASVSVTVDEKDGVTVVLANGEDAVWVEFGAGVYHNGAVGNSPHPKGAELGYTIGSMGRNGRKKAWGYYQNGALVLTHGTPASMPLYNATVMVCNEIDRIAWEIFA